MNMIKFFKSKFFIYSIIILFLLIIATPFLLYFAIIPNIVKNDIFINQVKKYVKKELNAELILDNVEIKTSWSPIIKIKTKKVGLIKNKNLILDLENIDSEFDLSKIKDKNLIVKKLGADNIFININELEKLLPKEEKETKKSDFKIDIYEALLYIKKCKIIYETDKKVSIKLLAKDLELSNSREPKYAHFKIFSEIKYKDNLLKIFFKDTDNVYFKDKKFHINNLKFKVNKSNIFLNLTTVKNGGYNVNLKTNNFEIKNVMTLLATNLIIPNGKEIAEYFNNLSGTFNLDFNMTEKDLKASVKANKISGELVPFANIPTTLTQGEILVNSKDIIIKDFKGYYGKRTANKLELYGSVKDYNKTVKTEIFVRGIVQDIFSKYLSKLAGIQISTLNKSMFGTKISSDISGKTEVKMSIKVPKGSDVLFENTSISSTKFDRAIGIDLTLIKNILNINHINYYIAEKIGKNNRPQKPLVTINGKVNIINGYLHELEFDIPEPLPSEFFNVLIRQKLFRSGTIAGKIKYINSKEPYISGNMTIKDVFIVGQRFIIRNAKIKTDNKNIYITSDGTLRRIKYNISAYIQNKILFPIVINKIDCNIDNIDIERVLKSFAPRTEMPKTPTANSKPRIKLEKSNISSKYFEFDETPNTTNTNNDEIEQITFQPNLLVIKECNFNVKNGVFKEITFGNLHAKLTLTKDGILEIKSNKFDFAHGTSGLKVYCDLMKQKYFIKLGARGIDSNTIATSVLNLPKEISGKGDAMLEFNTDSNAKLNGKIKFQIKDGSIAKLGLIQYLLNVVSLFRNPLAMINPVTVFDLVNIPDGGFKKINGTIEIKNNNAERIMIKSSSPQLSAFIIGRINLETLDSSLRIYTKFSNNKRGVQGVLRSLSLNALAQKVNNNPNRDENYYSTELSHLPKLDIGEDTAEVFLTKVDGDLQTSNFLSSLKKIK